MEIKSIFSECTQYGVLYNSLNNLQYKNALSISLLIRFDCFSVYASIELWLFLHL